MFHPPFLTLNLSYCLLYKAHFLLHRGALDEFSEFMSFEFSEYGTLILDAIILLYVYYKLLVAV